MTEELENKKQSLISRFSIWIFAALSFLLIIYTKETKKGFELGLKLSALSVIPAVFPFFILSDFLFIFYENKKGVCSSLFNKLFGISSSGLKAYLIGTVCGFPLGIKCASELYNQKKITLDECQTLSALASSPSLAFVISGVGLGLRGSLKEGVVLYLCVLFSSLITGMMFKVKEQENRFSKEIPEQNFVLANSIKKAAFSSISIGAYICFFSILIVLISSLVKNELLTAFITAILEIGNASVMLSGAKVLSPAFSFSLTAFALGFSGLSVFMQGLEYLPKEVSKTKILFMKLVQGVLAFITAYILFRLF